MIKASHLSVSLGRGNRGNPPEEKLTKKQVSVVTPINSQGMTTKRNLKDNLAESQKNKENKTNDKDIRA